MHLTLEDITAYADGEMAPDQRQTAQEHFETCEACRRELRFIQDLSAGFAASRIEPSPEFEAKTIRRLQALPLPRRPVWKLRPWLAPAFLSATAAATLAFLWFAVQAPQPLPRPAAAPTVTEDWQVADEMDFLEELDFVEDLELLEAMDEGVPG